MDNKILEDVKQNLSDVVGDAFDSELLQLIDGSILALSQVGCIADFEDLDEDTTWSDIIATPPNDVYDAVSARQVFRAVKHYIYLDVQMLFDPNSVPSTVVQIMRDKQQELLWRIEVAYHV